MEFSWYLPHIEVRKQRSHERRIGVVMVLVAFRFLFSNGCGVIMSHNHANNNYNMA